jgi:hypothetical protein
MKNQIMLILNCLFKSYNDSFQIKIYRFLVLSLVLTLFSCSKQDDMELAVHDFNGEISGKWYLVFSSGGRVLPKSYNIGDEIWNFENQKLTQSNFVHNEVVVYDYSVVDTLDGSQLKLDNFFFANIQLLTNDSLILIAEKFIGCGGSYTFVR